MTEYRATIGDRLGDAQTLIGEALTMLIHAEKSNLHMAENWVDDAITAAKTARNIARLETAMELINKVRNNG